MQYQLDMEWSEEAAAEFFCRKIGKRQVPYTELVSIMRIAVVRRCTFLYLLQEFDTLLLHNEVAVMHPDEIFPDIAGYYIDESEQAKTRPEN